MNIIMNQRMNADEAVAKIKSGDRVFIQGSAATPLELTAALGRRASELKGVEIVSLTTLGKMQLLQADYPDSFYINSLFVSSNTREAVNDHRGDYIPVFLSEISRLFQRRYLPLDVAMIHVSPPDQHGYCSLGVSVDITRAAVKNAVYVIAQINPNMPRTLGDGLIHVNDIHAMVEVTQQLPEVDYLKHITPEDVQIGKHCASIIEDGATLQMGIGTIPDAVMLELTGHKDLGVHTEMFSDGVLELFKKGVITNRYKKRHRQKIVSTFAIGTKALYDFIDDNPAFAFLESDYVNDTYVISKNPKVAAINSAIEIDITGQVCADSIGTYQFSGVGGQMDFIRGANLSEGGKPIIAMNSITTKGESKIVPFLKQGAGVVTTRAHVHYIVTEYGIAN
ncbi:MAG TPA: acetyl-CoA hydrolase/transferase C-terminal domain-containing protein, partial [Chitinophagaceae bacterium]|nr:acetyl-CoA hydrolase/transferase C-terminal domain-containing protein [Chitinophagaceae bacterium]